MAKGPGRPKLRGKPRTPSGVIKKGTGKLTTIPETTKWPDPKKRAYKRRGYGALGAQHGGWAKATYYQSASAREALTRLALECRVSRSAILDALIEAAVMRGARFVLSGPGRVRELPPELPAPAPSPVDSAVKSAIST
jgi:hypothetical protein